MVGAIEVIVRNNHVQYKFTIKRNITILKGDSATGKTTLIEMIGDYLKEGINSGIEVLCEKKCYVLEGVFWKENLKNIRNALVFIDEGNEFLETKDFARAIRNTDNYYVIATREALPMLPYSVEEIYGIVNKTKGYGKIKRLYSEFERIYHEESGFEKDQIVKVIVEDANAGYEFFKHYFSEKGIDCVTAKGKSNIVKELLNTSDDIYVLIIADGAAFGPEMEKVMNLRYNKNICLYLPESFEWIVLLSNVVDVDADVLANVENYADSRKYFSWEQFFTKYLEDITEKTYLQYSKKKLNENYLQDKVVHKITEIMPV